MEHRDSTRTARLMRIPENLPRTPEGGRACQVMFRRSRTRLSDLLPPLSAPSVSSDSPVPKLPNLFGTSSIIGTFPRHPEDRRMSVREARFRRPVQKQSAGTRCRETAQRSPNVPGVVRAEAVRMKTAARREAAGLYLVRTRKTGGGRVAGRSAGPLHTPCGQDRARQGRARRPGTGRTAGPSSRAAPAQSPRGFLSWPLPSAPPRPRPRKRRSARLCEKVFALGHDFFAATGASFSLPLVFYFKVSMLNK